MVRDGATGAFLATGIVEEEFGFAVLLPPGLVDSLPLVKVEAELADIEINLASMKSQLDLGLGLLKPVVKIEDEIKNFRKDEKDAEQKGDLSKVAEIRYGQIAELEKKLALKRQQLDEYKKDYDWIPENILKKEDVISLVAEKFLLPVEIVSRQAETESKKASTYLCWVVHEES